MSSNILGRRSMLFEEDFEKASNKLAAIVENSRFLIIGGAGTIGQAVTIEIFKRKPKVLHVVDLSENNMVELVRDIRGSQEYEIGDFRTFAIDSNSTEFEALIKNEGGYDYIFNLSALKHVRSEKDPYTLMRMIQVNIFNAVKTIELAQRLGVQKYFSVSTDKAANPVNLMGASKKLMEMFIMEKSKSQPVSLARFANVAFSDGSLLHGFNQRFLKRQPISAPSDIERYFMSHQEAGQLCLFSGLLGDNRDIFFPLVNEDFKLLNFSDLAKNYIKNKGYEPFNCDTEEEAKRNCDNLINSGRWPCYFFKSDTTGEKSVEEFYTSVENIDSDRYKAIGIIKNQSFNNKGALQHFVEKIEAMKKGGSWTKEDILQAIKSLLPSFEHEEKSKNLDQRM